MSRVRVRRLSKTAGGLAILALAWSTSMVAAQSPSAAPLSSESPLPAASADDALDLCWEVDSELCPLAAGHYQPQALVPPVAFDLDESWLDLRYYPDGFDIIRTGTALDIALAARPSGGLRDDTPTDPNDDLTQGTIDQTAAGVLAWLTGHPALEVTAGPTAMTLGGLPAQQLDVRAEHRAFGLLLIAEDAFSLGAGDAARFVVVDHPSGPLVFVVGVTSPDGAPVSDSDRDAAFVLAAPMLGSLSFPDGSAPASAPASPTD